MTLGTEVATRLAEPFPPAMLRENKAKGVTYVPISEVVARLNDVLGVDGWGYQVVDRWESGTQVTEGGAYPTWVMCHVRMTLANGNVKDGIGGQAVKLLKTGKDVVDLGDEWKGAASDALKKAAQHHGVTLDLARKEEALAWEAAHAPPTGWESYDAWDKQSDEFVKAARALSDENANALRSWRKAKDYPWPMTPDQLAACWTELRRLKESVAEAKAPAGTVGPVSGADDPPKVPPSAADAAPPAEELATRIMGLSETQLRELRTWAVAHEYPITPDGGIDVDAIPPERVLTILSHLQAA